MHYTCANVCSINLFLLTGKIKKDDDTVAIAVGTASGALALILCSLIVVAIVLKCVCRNQRQFKV